MDFESSFRASSLAQESGRRYQEVENPFQAYAAGRDPSGMTTGPHHRGPSPLLDEDVPELHPLGPAGVDLDGEVPLGTVEAIFVLGRHHPVDRDLDLPPHRLDPVLVPVVRL